MPSAVASNQEQWRPTHAEKEAAFVHIWSNQTTNQSYQICHLHEVLEGGVCLEANNLREPIASLSRFSNVSPVQHLKNAITSFPPMLRSKPRHPSRHVSPVVLVGQLGAAPPDGRHRRRLRLRRRGLSGLEGAGAR